MTDTPSFPSPGTSPGTFDPAAGAAGPVELDARALAQLRALDPDGRHGVLPRVLATYDTSLTRLQAQLAALTLPADAKAVGDMAHMLKSSSASVGALRLAQLCADAERAARVGDTGRLPSLVADIQAEAGRVQACVRAMLRD
jgi:HPt (histidine-containing phosphotransfer) domain-containing protein